MIFKTDSNYLKTGALQCLDLRPADVTGVRSPPGRQGFGSFECDDALVPDTVNGAKFIRDIYEKATV